MPSPRARRCKFLATSLRPVERIVMRPLAINLHAVITELFGRLLNHSAIPQSAWLAEFSLNHCISQAVLPPAAIRYLFRWCPMHCLAVVAQRQLREPSGIPA